MAFWLMLLWVGLGLAVLIFAIMAHRKRMSQLDAGQQNAHETPAPVSPLVRSEGSPLPLPPSELLAYRQVIEAFYADMDVAAISSNPGQQIDTILQRLQSQQVGATENRNPNVGTLTDQQRDTSQILSDLRTVSDRMLSHWDQEANRMFSHWDQEAHRMLSQANTSLPTTRDLQRALDNLAAPQRRVTVTTQLRLQPQMKPKSESETPVPSKTIYDHLKEDSE